MVIGLTMALNTTLRTQVELDLHGGSQFDHALDQALAQVAKEFGMLPSDPDPKDAINGQVRDVQAKG